MRLTAVLVACILIGILGSTAGAFNGFDIAPPTQGMARQTAYALRADELQIGVLSVSSYEFLYVEYGLSDDLLIGLAPIRAFQERADAWVKLSFGLTEDIYLGASLRLWYTPHRWSPYFTGQTALVLSFVTEESLTFHTGLEVTARRLDIGNAQLSPYGILGLELAEGVKLVAEVGINPAYARAGMLVRVLDVVDLTGVRQ